MKSLSSCQLYAFVDTAYLAGRPPHTVAQQLCDGGADIIQLRAKDTSLGEIRRLADAILPITQTSGVRLVINDWIEIATAVGAPLCHLGQEDFFQGGRAHVAEVVPAGSILDVGLSTHAPAQAERAIAAGAAYVAIGPVYATPTKPAALPVTLDYVRWAAAQVTIPWFAIGGINLRNAEQVLNAGARRICVVSAILDSPHPADTCRQFRGILDRFVV